MENLLKQPGWLRGLEVVTGLLTMIFAVLVLVFPDWGVSTLVAMLSFGLMLTGIRSISLAGYSDVPSGLKAVSVIVGIISLIIALFVFIFPGYGVLTLIFVVSFGLLVYGVCRLYLAYKLTGTIGWLRGIIAAVGIIDIILSIVVLVLPDLALVTLAAILGLVLLVSGAEMIASGVIGRTWLGDLVETAKDELDVK